MELLDIRDENGNCTGEVKERSAVHRDGDIHGASHIFIIRRNQKEIEILLQKRSDDKDSFPGCYDISAAGHLPAGEDYLTGALRELEEELGIKAEKTDLIDIGPYWINSREIFYGRPFINHEICRIYLYERKVNIEDLHLQKEEVSSVKWMPLEECIKKAQEEDPDYCILEEGLLRIRDHYIDQ